MPPKVSSEKVERDQRAESVLSGRGQSDKMTFKLSSSLLETTLKLDWFKNSPDTLRLKVCVLCCGVQAEIKAARRTINNLRYANNTTFMAESEELKTLLMKVKEGSEKVGLKLKLKA